MPINYIPDEIHDVLKTKVLEYNKEEINHIKEKYDIHLETLNTFVADILNKNNAFDYQKYMSLVDVLFPDIKKYSDEIYKVYAWITKIGFISEDDFIEKTKNIELDVLRESIRQEISLLLLYIYSKRLDFEKIEYYIDITGGKFYGEQY